VSNPELEARYGGLLVPHARDEAVFDPDRFDRAEARARLGLGSDDRLILFGGTPRAHKGILELLQALEDLGDERVRVGVFDTPELQGLRQQIGSLARWMRPLPVRAFDDLPELLAAVDLSCALQAPDHPVSQHQMPAKVTDAMAMAVPCLVTPVPPLQPLIDKDVVEVFDGDVPLAARIREVLADPEASADRARRARDAFLESYSYAAVRPTVAAAIDRLLEAPPPLAPELSSLVTTARQLFGPPGTRTPAPRPRVPAGATYDLAVFWKQNDTGIYGRRQDMFLKYLEQSGRFHTIVHFDQPMAAEGLLQVARRSFGTPDQNRLVLAQTVRRLARRGDHGAVRQRTYLYAGGSASRALRLPGRDHYPDWVRGVLEREGIGARPLLCWVYPTNTFLPDLIDALQPAVVVADVVDDNRTWYAAGTPMHDQLERNYAEVLARSDVVLANCEPVAESMRSFTSQVEVVPNACELPDAPAARARPSALAGLSGPIIGYAGNLSDRLDLPLLRSLARARPDWTFVLLGSAHRDRSALDLAREPNIRLLGPKPYDEARELIRHFDVGLIPHLDNDMTRSMNPLKAFVYCSLGVPVVSTPVANLDELAGLITVAEGTDGFVAAIDEALRAGRPAPDRDALLPHSWTVRVERVLELVDTAASSRPGNDDG
jgi:glycosyltransferase involved in cell wall biosynthesis